MDSNETGETVHMEGDSIDVDAENMYFDESEIMSDIHVNVEDQHVAKCVDVEDGNVDMEGENISTFQTFEPIEATITDENMNEEVTPMVIDTSNFASNSNTDLFAYKNMDLNETLIQKVTAVKNVVQIYLNNPPMPINLDIQQHTNVHSDQVPVKVDPKELKAEISLVPPSNEIVEFIRKIPAETLLPTALNFDQEECQQMPLVPKDKQSKVLPQHSMSPYSYLMQRQLNKSAIMKPNISSLIAPVTNVQNNNSGTVPRPRITPVPISITFILPWDQKFIVDDLCNTSTMKDVIKSLEDFTRKTNKDVVWDRDIVTLKMKEPNRNLSKLSLTKKLSEAKLGENPIIYVTTIKCFERV